MLLFIVVINCWRYFTMTEKEHNEMEEKTEDVQDILEENEPNETDEHNNNKDNTNEQKLETEEKDFNRSKEDEIIMLNKENESLKQEIETLKDRLLRLQAEFDNYRKRTEKERIHARKYEAQALATELLPVIDNFERALETEVDESSKGFYEGVKMVYEQFMQAMKSQGIEVMDVVNKPFDPNLHHAVMQDEDDSVESNIITEEFQKGYMLKDKVLRPAMVKVNK